MISLTKKLKPKRKKFEGLNSSLAQSSEAVVLKFLFFNYATVPKQFFNGSRSP